MPGSPGGAGVYQREELFFSHEQISTATHQCHSEQIRFDPAGALSHGSLSFSSGSPRRSLYLATDHPAQVGHSATVRYQLRHLCLVRCFAELRERSRTSGWRLRAILLAESAASDCQGYSKTSRDLLADDANGCATTTL